mmetsp:Transcript_600/g.2454  ORF Transcript_600/g.2454 Transcript_600/m.2454 type:complete len:203 (-) Transcript_600:235-843(-)
MVMIGIDVSRVPSEPAGALEQLVLDLRLRELLVSSEHVRLLALREAQLVHVHVRAVGDEADERILGKQRERLRERLPQRRELILHQADVDDEEVRGRWGLGSLQVVLDGGVRREELRGQVRLGDARVVRGEVVARVAEGADPELAVEIHARVRVEARRAALAPHGVVRHHGHLGQVFPGGHERAEGHHALRGLDLAVRPDVP